MQHLLRLFFGSGADGDRPVLITVLFWGGVIPTLVVRTFVTAPELLVPTWVVYVLIATLVALWPLLRWRAGGRPIATAAFALTVLLVLFADGTGAAQLLLPLTIAQVIIVTGWTGTLLTIAAYALAQILGMRLVYERPWRDVALQTLSVVLLMTMIAVVIDLVVREQRRRREYARLLDELTIAHTDLAVAHEELQKRSEQVRELAVQAERARLAREVHDAVGHHLTVVKLDLTNALRLRGRDDDTAWSTVGDARDSASQALDEVRRAVRALGPGPLASATLGTALEALVASFSRDGLTMAYEVAGDVRPVTPTVAATFYRVAEEALTNIRRHARGATRATVRLGFGATATTLEVTDNGDAVGTLKEGFGLAGVRARLAELDGTLRIETPDEGGVILSARVPLADVSVGPASPVASVAR